MHVMFERILLRCFRSRALDPIGFFAQFFALNSLSMLLMTKKLLNVSKNGDKHAHADMFLTLSATTNSKFVIICLQII